MTHAELVERLAHHRTLATAPREELEWLATHGELRRLDAGAIVSAMADGRPEGMFIVLSGHAAIWVDRGAGQHKVLDWHAGDIAGLLPYSRMIAPPGDSITDEPSEFLLIREADFQGLIHDCHEVTSILVHVMLDRARQFTSSDLHDEKMISLGRLAAGLAHELNNPASAVARSAKLLTDRLIAAEIAARTLGGATLSDEQLGALDSTRECCLRVPTNTVRSPIEQAEREDEISDWLDDHNADSSISEQLAETGVTMDALDKLADAIDGQTLDAALRWVATGCSVRSLALEIESAAQRIHHLVTEVKGFTYMDQASMPQPVNIGECLLNTLGVLKAKAQSKSVGIVVNVEDNLPTIDGFGGELNQVWMNLIDNAIDAVDQAGHIEVTAMHDGTSVVVRVIDNGPGVPPEIKDRIFDPFFTTKGVGKGTGLGLDISNRLVRHHRGIIELDSKPGRTEFRVSLPTLATQTPGGHR